MTPAGLHPGRGWRRRSGRPGIVGFVRVSVSDLHNISRVGRQRGRVPHAHEHEGGKRDASNKKLKRRHTVSPCAFLSICNEEKRGANCAPPLPLHRTLFSAYCRFVIEGLEWVSTPRPG